MINTINKVNFSDLNQITEIDAQNKESFNNEQFEKCLNLQHYLFYKLNFNNNIKGFCIFLISGNDLEIIKLVVDKKYYRKGLGSKMLQFIIDYGTSNNYENIFLEVNSNNIEAYNLYKKYHFHLVRIIKNYYSEADGLVLQRKLL